MNRNASSVAIYVMSCDKTADVALHFTESFSRYWSDCPFPIFFGINEKTPHLESIGAEPLRSAVADWKQETLVQLRALRKKAPTVTHALVFLDDFVLSRQVPTARISKLALEASARNVSYLRLRRLEEGVWGYVLQRFQRPEEFGNERCIAVRNDHPYYSSLQVALWRLDHLYACVSTSENIWDFEKVVDNKNPHLAVRESLVHYRHIVEKGRWDITARDHCMRAIGWFQPGDRAFRVVDARARAVASFKNAMFSMFGYLPMRIKNALSKIGVR